MSGGDLAGEVEARAKDAGEARRLATERFEGKIVRVEVASPGGEGRAERIGVLATKDLAR